MAMPGNWSPVPWSHCAGWKVSVRDVGREMRVSEEHDRRAAKARRLRLVAYLAALSERIADALGLRHDVARRRVEQMSAECADRSARAARSIRARLHIAPLSISATPIDCSLRMFAAN